MTDVRKATSADLSSACASLAKAFSDDPVMTHLIPASASGRDARLAKLMSMEAKGALKHESMWSSADGQAHAIWKPPGTWKVGGVELVKQTPTAIAALRGRLPLALSVLTGVEKKHPVDPPHWYLAVLGTEPEGQGKGKGSAVMRPVLDLCDTEGVPAYLESSKEKNVPFYERHGFKVTEQIDLARGGPPIWLMWREPR